MDEIYGRTNTQSSHLLLTSHKSVPFTIYKRINTKQLQSDEYIFLHTCQTAHNFDINMF